MKFYEYNRSTGIPLINEVNSPTDVLTDDPIVFLVYAPNQKIALAVAHAHIFDKIPLTKYYGMYNDEKYRGEFLCAMWEYKL